MTNAVPPFSVSPLGARRIAYAASLLRAQNAVAARWMQ
jgi:hypothetical protein